MRLSLTRGRAALSALFALSLVAVHAESSAAQQAGIIRGVVTDSATASGVPGVQITITGTTSGTVTNDAGQYTLRGVRAGALTVRAQRVGFTPQDRNVTVAGGDTITANFTLRSVAVLLSEVVSVGYGTASRRDVTNAIASVTAKDIENNPTAGVDAALQGKVPGVQVVQNAGNPGNGISLRIRGPASLNAGNQPLYVVDGIPIMQENFTQLGMGGQDVTSISTLNPDEISSIDILKDAAAAAIYGSRGSNGVVLITTKRGRAGATRFQLNSYYGTQSNPKKLGLLNAKEYVDIFNESAKNDGYTPAEYDFVPGTDDAVSYDWEDAVFRRAPMSDAQLSMSGGSDRMRFFVSAGNFDQRGIVIGSAYQRQAGRLNLEFDPNSKLYLRTNVGLTRESNDRIEGDGSLDGVLTNAIGMQPMRPILGSFFGFGGSDEGLRYSNPVALAAYNSTNNKTLRAMGNIEARYMVRDRLSFTARFGADVLGLDETQWESPKVDIQYAASAGGVGKQDHTTATRYVSEGFATFDAISNATQRLNVVGGASAEFNNSELNFIRGEGFPSGFTKYVRNASVITSYDGAATSNTLGSFFTRATYSLFDRYFFNASVRADRSSRFGANNRWGTFPSFSAGWALTDESFASGLAKLATVKVRGSYGVTGNQGIGDFASLSLASGAPYGTTPGIAQTSLGNPNLRWETTRAYDAGVDVGFFDSRVNFIVDYYSRKTTDLLVSRPIAAFTGFTSIFDNIGSIQNRGFDLALSTVNLKPATSRGLEWTSNLNVTFNKNKVLGLYGGQPIITGINGRQSSIVAVGKPLGEFWMYHFEGVDPQTGDAIISDLDGDTLVGPNDKLIASDKTFAGSPHPKYYGGFTNQFTFGSLGLNTFLQFSQGGKIFNMMRIFTDDGACSYDNKTRNVLKRWQNPGDITDMPRMSYDCASGADDITDRFIEDGSYVRLGEVTLSYSLPTSITNRIQLANARLYVSGRNLHTWTKYTGYNPDVNSAGSDENVIMGTDYYAYPLPRTFTFGLSAGW